jgi:hypothetical protein
VLSDPSLGNLLSTKVTLGAGGQPLPIPALLDAEVPEAAPFRSAVEESGERAERIVGLARRWEGVASNVGIHACGVLISDSPLAQRIPVRRDHAAKDPYPGWITEWDGWDCDALGALKLDALGLRNLDILSDVASQVPDFDPDNVPTDLADPRAARAWRLIAEGRTAGCFQLESSGMQQLCRDIVPSGVGELADVIALFRPGPLGEDMHLLYAERKAGRSKDFYTNYTSDPAEAAVLAEVLAGDVQPTYAALAAWLQASASDPNRDWEAIAAVLGGAIANYWTVTHFLGEPPRHHQRRPIPRRLGRSRLLGPRSRHPSMITCPPRSHKPIGDCNAYLGGLAEALLA